MGRRARLLTQLSLRSRAVVAAVAVIAMVAVTATVTFRASHAVLTSRAEVLTRYNPAVEAADTLLGHLVDQETGERGFVITGDPTYLGPYEQGRGAADADLTRLTGLLRGTSALPLVHAVSTAAEAWRSGAADPEIAARRASGEAADALVDQGTGRTLFEQVRRAITALEASVTTIRGAAQSKVTADIDHLRTAQAVEASLIGLLLLLGLVALWRWVLRPVRELQYTMERVSGGDLLATVSTSGPAELRALGESAEIMRRRILDELDTAVAARTALEQQTPVVAALARLLAPPAPPTVDGVEVALALHAAEGVLAGDLVLATALGDSRLAVAVADVSGHGPDAALVALRLKHTISAELRAGHGPASALRAACQDFVDAPDPSRWASAFIAIVDPATATATWSSAGHPPARLVPDDGPLQLLEPAGPMLHGAFGDGAARWLDQRLDLPTGVRLLVMTDGALEPAGPDGVQLEEGPLDVLLDGQRGAGPSELIDAVHDLVRSTGDGWTLDDVTLLCLRLT